MEMSEDRGGEITLLLKQWTSGDQQALDRLITLVYPELRAIAAHYMTRERLGHTLQPTALVHEAYLRLVRQPEKEWHDRAHFFAVAARIVRGILVDHARARRASKRSGERLELTMPEPGRSRMPAGVDLMDLDAALEALQKIDSRQSRIVELRFFGGLSMEEVAQAMGISMSAAKREGTIAKTWIRRHIQGENGNHE
jgi:RNA polymerase sigma factor (TIGR02999 family)